MDFSLTPPNTSLRTPSEFGSLKRSAKAFSLKKPSLSFHKGASLPRRRSRDDTTSNSTPSALDRTNKRILESPYGDDVICISREGISDSSSADEASPDELRTPTASTYASSYSSSSSSTYHLHPGTNDRSLSPGDGVLDQRDPRRGSRLSMTSSWVDHHLQELDLSYDQDGVYEIELVTTDDGFLSRKDSFILPPGETFQSYQQNQNLPVVPAKQFYQLSRPLPCTPPTSPGFNSQSRRIRPLPPPPSP